jgi:hypothetical protein
MMQLRSYPVEAKRKPDARRLVRGLVRSGAVRKAS